MVNPSLYRSSKSLLSSVSPKHVVGVVDDVGDVVVVVVVAYLFDELIALVMKEPQKDVVVADGARR